MYHNDTILQEDEITEKQEGISAGKVTTML